MEVSLGATTCPTNGCGVMFWVAEAFLSRRRADKKTFYCPNGHDMSFPGETDSQKLAKLERIQTDKNNEIERLNEELRKSSARIKRFGRKSKRKQI